MSEELQKLLEQHDAEVRAKAIDEFLEEITNYCSMSDMNRKMIKQIAERLKEGEEQ